MAKTRLRMLADIRVRPSVEPAFLHPDQIVRWQQITEAIPLLHQGTEFTGLRMEGERRRVPCARGVRRLVRAVRIKALDRGLRLGLDAQIARRPDAYKQRAGFRIDDEITVLVTLDDAEDALFRDHLRHRRLGSPCAHPAAPHQRACAPVCRPDVDAPDAVLVGYQHVVVSCPGETIRFVQILDVAIRCRLSVAIVAQQREVTGALLGDQNIAVGQDEYAALDSTRPVRNGVAVEPRRDLRRLSVVGHE